MSALNKILAILFQACLAVLFFFFFLPSSRFGFFSAFFVCFCFVLFFVFTKLKTKSYNQTYYFQ